MKYERLTSQPENPFAKLIPDQIIAVIPSFTLESGVTLYNVPVAYSTRGKLSAQGDNAMVICHALSGSADVGDWWGPLLGGPGRAFDVSRFFVICINSLGSPYGSASPVTSKDGDISKGQYGPEFPLTTIRDDVRISKLLMDDLGVRQVATVIGGSMGGMLVLEFAYLGQDYVRSIVPIATSARHSAWCISWGEAQRQSIYSDPKYDDGYYTYEDPPATGLGAARMSALLTYRSRDSFELRFGRKIPDPSRRQNINGPQRHSNPINEHFEIHNEGHKKAGVPRPTTGNNSPSASTPSSPHPNPSRHSMDSAGGDEATAETVQVTVTDPQFHGATPLPTTLQPVNPERRRATTYFSAQSYLRYQGDKFIKRFDANCYIAITRKLDTHDVSLHYPHSSPRPLHDALAMIQQPTLVLGIESDGLFTFAEQQEIAAAVPNARLAKIESPEGHDAFLLQFEQVNAYILGFLREALPDLWARQPEVEGYEGDGEGVGVGAVVKNSTFGEAEVEDITAW